MAAKTTLLMEVRLILGDQLHAEHSWFEEVNDNVCYVMFEMRQALIFQWLYLPGYIFRK